jgi:DNA-binding NarL/FixJ family response regulator
VTTVLVAEDRTGMRELVKLLLADEADIEVVGEATDGKEVLRRVSELHPDVVVLDLGLPELDGEVVLSELRRQHFSCRVVILSGQVSAISAGHLVDVGAAAVVEKGVSGWEAEMVAAIRRQR